jgi:hypothetical protein
LKRATVIPGGPEGAGKGTQIPAQPGSPSLASLAGDDSWPSIAHVPGTGSEPDRAPLVAAKRLVRAPVVAQGWESDAAYRYGAALYAGGFFWEAHEVWEAVWKACPPNGVERRLLRGLIQLANAALKIRMGRGRAAVRLLREAEELLREVGVSAGTAEVMGVALAPLGAAAGALAAAVERGGGAGSVDSILQPLAAVAAPLDSVAFCTIVHAPEAEPAL